MSTKTEKCIKELPQHSKLITSVKPTKQTCDKVQKTKVPLAPENVSAIYNSDKTKITIKLTVYIDSAVNVESLDIYEFINDLSPCKQREIFIVYDYKAETPESLNLYTFSFEVPCNSNSIETIETFLWNEDPETSRGTETTVQPPTDPILK